MISRGELLADLLRRRVLVLGGAAEAPFAAQGASAADPRGQSPRGANEGAVRDRAEVALARRRERLETRADIVETLTAGEAALSPEGRGLEDDAGQMYRGAAELARRACREAEAEHPARPRFVAGVIGLPAARAQGGGAAFQALVNTCAVRARALADGGADVLLVEAREDVLALKAALIACRDAAPELPVAVSATIARDGRTVGGQTVEALAVTVGPWSPLWIGLDCPRGPASVQDELRALAAVTASFVAVSAGVGVVGGEGRRVESSEDPAAEIARLAREGLVNIVRRGVVSTADHLRRLRAVADAATPRIPPGYDPARLAGAEAVELSPSPRPLLVGERTNALGSRRFKQLVEEGRWPEAAEVGRRQVRRGGALDVCVALPAGDEKGAMTSLILALREFMRRPLFVDSTDPGVFAAALEVIPGRPALNSVNLQDGGARLDEAARLARRFGAVIVAGCIDEHSSDGMARTAERKLEVAQRLLARLEGGGLDRREILIDPLVFPAVTGDPRFRGSAGETVKGLKLITERLGALTIAGISNVSFGLPAAARKILDAVFLHHCVQAGLDAAIVNTERLARFSSLDREDVRLAEEVLFSIDDAPIHAFVARHRPARRR